MDPAYKYIFKSRILIADGSPITVAALQKCLLDAGYQDVKTTADAREIHPLHRRWHFDLIILDIGLKGQNGISVLQDMSAETNDDYLPVLALITRNDREGRIAVLDIGARDFLTKPFDKQELMARVRNILEVRNLLNRQQWQAEIFESEVRRRTAQLETAYLEMVDRLGLVGEYRDTETGAHVLRMSKSCALLAKATGLGGDFARHILHASRLHDLGKIGIPDSILLKPGRISESEMAVMRTHTTIGASMLEGNDSELVRMARSIALTHHEQWDGSGYPYGLKETAIPIEGRIASLCDVFDALLSERPYKHPWSIKKAVTYINQRSGIAFDPHLIEAFNENLPGIIQLRKDHPDESSSNEAWPNENPFGELHNTVELHLPAPAIARLA